jgi:hypothetical protein
MPAPALARCLEVLGEAASKVTPETGLRFSAIPFAKMVSMRNHLIHAAPDSGRHAYYVRKKGRRKIPGGLGSLYQGQSRLRWLKQRRLELKTAR